MTWEKQPAIEGKMGGCLCCGIRASFFKPEMEIGVGFGYAALHKDKEVIWQETPDTEEYLTGAQAEEMAQKDPDHDWQIVLEAPLSSRTYQRHTEGQWVLISQGEGFA